MKKYTTFRQSSFRAWTWIGIVVMSIVSMALSLFAGLYSLAFLHVFLAWVSYWVDQLEKELTRRNIADESNPDAPPPT